MEQILQQHAAYGATFSEIGQHAPIRGILSAVELLKETQADFVVSVGGGSPIDAAKAIIHKYTDLGENTKAKTMPHVGIPTTLSAAEYTVRSWIFQAAPTATRVQVMLMDLTICEQVTAGFTNENGMKTSVTVQELGLAGIILDAELTLATPERLW